MNDSQALANPFDECLPWLALRFAVLTVVALVTTSTLLLVQPPGPPPSCVVPALHATPAPGEDLVQKRYAHWYDDFPSAAEDPEAELGPTDPRTPPYLRAPRPILGERSRPSTR
jgi:hypothetical protein